MAGPEPEIAAAQDAAWPGCDADVPQEPPGAGGALGPWPEGGETGDSPPSWVLKPGIHHIARAGPSQRSGQLGGPGFQDSDARDGGNAAEARAVAGQVRRWARALGVGILETGAAELS